MEKFVPIAILLLIWALIFAFWWPMRKEAYGKSMPVILILGVVAYLFGYIVNPTLLYFLPRMVQGGMATAEHLFQIKIFWMICENLFTIGVILLILSDVGNLLPGEVKKRSGLYSFLGAVYKQVIPMGILLLILQVLPAGVLYYFIGSKTGAWGLGW